MRSSPNIVNLTAKSDFLEDSNLVGIHNLIAGELILPRTGYY